jgi:hypothetical protein
MSCKVLRLSLVGESLRVNYTIVHVSGEDASFDLWLELHIDYSLKRSRRIGHAEEYDKWLKQPFRSEERGFPFVPFSYPDIVVPPSDVELSEESASHQSVDDLGNERRDVPVADCPFVEGSVVLHRTKLAILLFDEEEVGRIGAFGFMDSSPSQMLFYKFMTLHDFFLGEWEELPGKRGQSSGQEFNGVIPNGVGWQSL